MPPMLNVWLCMTAQAEGRKTHPVLIVDDDGQEVGDWHRICQDGCAVLGIPFGSTYVGHFKVWLVRGRQVGQLVEAENINREVKLSGRGLSRGIVRVFSDMSGEGLEVSPQCWPARFADRLRLLKRSDLWLCMAMSQLYEVPPLVAAAFEEFITFWRDHGCSVPGGSPEKE